MASDLDKRTSSRPGAARRTWLLIVFIFGILVTMHLVLPQLFSFSSKSGSNEDAVYTNRHLKPKNYLNLTDLRRDEEDGKDNPFEFCSVRGGEGDRVGSTYGNVALSQSRIHLGSGSRVRRVISKALAGQPVTISVLGGSVSACHGAGDDPISPKCYPSRFFQWWNTVFPHPASELTNGAMRRTTSEYFGYCSTHHIPDVADLIVVELDASDSPDNAREMTDHFEVLIRSLLLRPDTPAVLLLGHFSPQLHKAWGSFGADHYHNVVAQFYDVPHLSTKSILFTDYMKKPKSINRFYADPILANPAGHQLITDVLIAYFQTQICDVWEDWVGGGSGQAQGGALGGGGAGLFGGIGQRKGVPEPHPNHLDGHEEVEVDAEGNRIKLGLPKGAGLEFQSSPYAVPAGRMNTRPDDERLFEEISPFCVSANDLVNPLPPSLFQGTGWSAYHPTASGGGDILNTKSHYWYSTLAGSKLRIPVMVGAGDIGVYYLASGSGEGSEVKCQVDDNYGGAKTLKNVIPGLPDEETPRLAIIDHFVARGNHFVECTLVGDEEEKGVPVFKITGIFTT
ncbi:hypothetical protein AAF712_013802 [Marasmius tenuissimus]|uniref:Capsular associated protein n=1 Tax=Marasmius tenuissimus TaxID=585030 RepID=A0ABR2ZDS4_9AGAR